MEDTELTDFSRGEDNGRIEEDKGEEETNFGGSDIGGSLLSLIWSPSVDWEVTDINRPDLLKKYFGEEFNEVRDIRNFLKRSIIMEKECTNPIIKYLIDTQDMIVHVTNAEDKFIDYSVSYYGEPYYNDKGVKTRQYRTFDTTKGVIENPNEINIIIDDLRYHYDTWRRLELKNFMKKTGLPAAIGLSVIALITGLSLGLKRSGTDIVRAAKRKAEKLNPAEKIDVIPWTEIEEASGHGLILIGDHIYLVIGGTLIYLYTRRKHK